jgi:glucosamine kinase
MSQRHLTYAGVDAGATRTRCVVVDEAGRVLGSAEGAAGAYHPERAEESAKAVGDCVRAAAEKAGVEVPVTGLGMGVAGCGRGHDAEDFLRLLRPEELAERWILTPDTHAALWGAFPEGHGIVVIAGTGAVAYGRAEDGREVFVGGWGREIDDEGGAWWLGHEVMRAVARASDGRGKETVMTGMVLAEIGCGDAREMVTWARKKGRTPAEVAALARLADQAAAEGDAVARNLTDRAGYALMDLAVACAERMGGERQVALVGGLGERAGMVAEAFRRRLGEDVPRLRLVAAEASAVMGAVAMVRQGEDHPGT